MMNSLMHGLLSVWLGSLCLMNVQAHADGFCPPGSYDPNSGRAPAITCVPIAGGGQQQAPRQQQPPPVQWESRWGAIATDGPSDALGVAIDRRSKLEASQAAMQNCQSTGGVNCKIDITYDNQCAAIVVGDGAYNVGNAPTVDQAVASGVRTCRSSGFTNCRAYYTACSLPVRIR